MKPRILYIDMSRHTQLDAAFYLTVHEQFNKMNAEANFVSENGKCYSWVFYKTEWFFWKRYLQPDDTLADNGIEPNTLITAERLVMEEV